MRVTIKLKDKRLRRRLSKAPDTDQMLDTAAQQVVSDAVELAPVDTGRLRNSIRILDEGRDAVEVGSDEPYATHVEHGTRNTRAQPFLRPAMERAKFNLRHLKW